MYDPIIWDAAEEYGVPYEVARFLFKKESDFNPNAVSPKGAEGIGQIMPDTQKYLGVKNPFDPRENIFASIRYLKEGYDKYHNWGQAGGYYHSGPGSMNKVKGDINKLGPQGRQYAASFSKFDSPEYNPYYAPMDLQGRAQIPEVLPVSNPTPPTQIPETKKMDDYSQMAIFNPYIQMALGIMAGNSGMNKSQAFSNAMGGGLTALNAAQRSAAYDQQVKAQASRVRREDAQYEMMQNRARMQQEYFQKMLSNPDLSPEERKLAELGAMGNVDTGMDLFKTSMQGKYNEERMQLQRELADSKLNKNTDILRMPLTEDTNSPVYGYTVDTKGNVYSGQGAKVEGTQQKWAIDMAGRKNNYMTLDNFEKKNNPELMITPEKMPRWINMAGKVIQPNADGTYPTQDEAIKTGYRYVSEKQAENIQGVNSAITQINHIEDMLFNPENGIYSKNSIPDWSKDPAKAAKGYTERGKAILGFGEEAWQDNVRMYKDAVDAFSSQLSKLQGQVGTLTEQDVQKAVRMFAGLMPNINPFAGDIRLVEAKKVEAQKRMAAIKEFVRSKGVDPDLVFGTISGGAVKTPGGVYIKGLE